MNSIDCHPLLAAVLNATTIHDRDEAVVRAEAAGILPAGANPALVAFPADLWSPFDELATQALADHDVRERESSAVAAELLPNLRLSDRDRERCEAAEEFGLGFNGSWRLFDSDPCNDSNCQRQPCLERHKDRRLGRHSWSGDPRHHPILDQFDDTTMLWLIAAHSNKRDAEWQRVLIGECWDRPAVVAVLALHTDHIPHGPHGDTLADIALQSPACPPHIANRALLDEPYRRGVIVRVHANRLPDFERLVTELDLFYRCDLLARLDRDRVEIALAAFEASGLCAETGGESELCAALDSGNLTDATVIRLAWHADVTVAVNAARRCPTSAVVDILRNHPSEDVRCVTSSTWKRDPEPSADMWPILEALLDPEFAVRDQAFAAAVLGLGDRLNTATNDRARRLVERLAVHAEAFDDPWVRAELAVHAPADIAGRLLNDPTGVVRACAAARADIDTLDAWLATIPADRVCEERSVATAASRLSPAMLARHATHPNLAVRSAAHGTPSWWHVIENPDTRDWSEWCDETGAFDEAFSTAVGAFEKDVPTPALDRGWLPVEQIIDAALNHPDKAVREAAWRARPQFTAEQAERLLRAYVERGIAGALSVDPRKFGHLATAAGSEALCALIVDSRGVDLAAAASAAARPGFSVLGGGVCLAAILMGLARKERIMFDGVQIATFRFCGVLDDERVRDEFDRWATVMFGSDTA